MSRNESKSTISRSYIIGSSLLILILFQYVLPALLLFINIKINSFYFPIAIIVSLWWLITLSIKFSPNQNRLLFPLVNTVIYFAVFLFSVLIASRFYDCSFDGQFYQQKGIFFLADGWNPVKSLLKQEPLLVNYPKSIWYVGSCGYSFLGKIEPIKYIQFIFIFTSFLFSLSAFEAINKHKRYVQILLSLVVAFNPVSLYQSLSFYVDGILASIISILISLFILYYKGQKKHGILFFILGALSFLANIKFTGVGFAIILMGGFAGLFLIEKQWKEFYRLSIISVLAFIFGIGILGYQPYVTNTVDFGHPFYPLNEKDLMANQGPKDFKENNRFTNLIISNYFRSESWLSSDNYALSKTPFDVSDQKAFRSPAPRVGGFGSLFSALLSISLLLLIFLIFNSRLKNWQIYYMLAIILFSVLIMSACWWARYVPQFFLIPLILVSWVLSDSIKNKLIKYIGYFGIIVFLVNAGIILKVYYTYNTEVTKKIHNQLNMIGKRPVDLKLGVFQSIENRFQEEGIPYQIKGSLNSDHSIELAGGKWYTRFQFNDSLFFKTHIKPKNIMAEQSDSSGINILLTKDNPKVILGFISNVKYGEKIFVKGYAKAQSSFSIVVKDKDYKVHIDESIGEEEYVEFIGSFIATKNLDSLEIYLKNTGESSLSLKDVIMEYNKFKSNN
jgi:hypothetical protein